MSIQPDILGSNAIPINHDFVVTLTKGGKESIDQEARRSCKILKFPSEFTFDEVLLNISKLDSKVYPNLFIFVIETEKIESSDSIKTLKNFLVSFSNNRSIILQLTSKVEKGTKMFYKEENFGEFFDIKQQNVIKIGIFSNFPTFFWLYSKPETENFEGLLLEKLPEVQNSSLIIKFLRALNIPEEFFDTLALKCATNGSKSDLLAVINGFIDENGKVQDFYAELFIRCTFNSTSVLKTAVLNSNQVNIDFLVDNCIYLIQQLSFDHQVEVSTAANASNQFEVLCNLVEIADFPFPENLDSKSIANERLLKIIETRTKFHTDVLAENLEEIKKFREQNSSLKFVYNSENKSALLSALNSKKFKAFFLLKSLRFDDHIIEHYGDKLNEDEDRRKAKGFAAAQRKKNVDISVPNKEKSILLLSMRSMIYKRSIVAKSEEEYQQMIKKWYIEIYKTEFGSILLDAAAQCGNLKIIFDFECDSTENVDVSSTSGSSGATYPASKWIFIGAKVSGKKKREQQIKGVIVHEICHYVMRLVYQNDEKPYYKGDEEVKAKMFDEIVTEIELMLFPSKTPKEVEVEEEEVKLEVKSDDKEKEVKEPLDDECDGVISTVYSLYKKEDWHPELIVRPAHIQAQFDDEEIIEEIEEKYEKLFEFFRTNVIPELIKFNLNQRENVQTFNKIAGVLSELETSQLKLAEFHDMSDLLTDQSAILTSNVPKLLLLNIYRHLNQKDENLLDVQNIFITPQCLNNSYTLNTFKDILKQNLSFKIFVDSSKEEMKTFELINPTNDTKFFLITGNKKNFENKLKNYNSVLKKTAIDYNWRDLTAESQHILLQTKINFQNNSKFSLFEFISNGMDQNQQESVNTSQMVEIFDDQLLNLLVENSKISVNSKINEEADDKRFRILFRLRGLIKSYKIIKHLKPQNEELGLEMLDEGIEQNVESKTGMSSMHLTNSPKGMVFKESVGDDKTFMKNLQEPNYVRSKIEKELQNMIENNIQEIDKSEKMSQEQMLEDVKGKKFVLISDKAGSGKSWILKNISNRLKEMYPKRWTTYVDLKQFIKEFKATKGELEFVSFMVEKIIKPKSKYEAEIFKKLYKNGQVCILFDGFDEIAPDCAEFVTKLFKSFQQNGGNQLWIATREYFEVNLKEKLELDAVFKLDEFTEESGIDLIASSWVLSEIEEECANLSECDVISRINFFPNLQNYKKTAEKISKKTQRSDSNSIGMPQFYKMIADITKNNKDSAINFTRFRVFDKCVDIQYERWSREKGELRAKANTESQKKELIYRTLHQLIAMESIFPNKPEFCDLDRKTLKEWTHEEIIACGLLTKKGEKFLFSHETFREFYAADFILRNLEKSGTKNEKDVTEILINFLTVQKFGIVRMFLNEAFEEKKSKIEPKVSRIHKHIYNNSAKLENLSQIFTENLENLADFLFKMFKNGKIQQAKEILLKNNDIIIKATRHVKLFIKTQNFVIDFLDTNDLRIFLLQNANFLIVLSSALDIETINQFIGELKRKTNPEFIREMLQAKDEQGRNLFFYLIASEQTDSNKFQGCLEIVTKLIDYNDTMKMMRECKNGGLNVFHLCSFIKNEKKMNFVWTELEKLSSSQNCLQQFKELFVQQISDNDENVLYIAAFCDKIEFHETLWELLLKTFENREELKELMMQGNKYGDNFIHYLVILNKPDILEFTFKKIKQNFRYLQYEEILRSKGQLERNSLQYAACASKDIKTHQTLWKTFREFYKSDEEFLEFLKEVDNENNNVFQLAAVFSTSEIFELLIGELDKIASREEIKKYLNTLDMSSRNLLHSAATQNKSLELHQRLWKIIRKYFDSSEILRMVKRTTEYGNNVLQIAVVVNTKEIVELTWKEIETLSKENVPELTEYLCQTNKEGENILHLLMKAKDAEKLNYFWNELEVFFSSQKSQHYKELLSQKTSDYNQNVLHYATGCNKVECHEILWKLLLKTFENREELKELLKQGDNNGYNFIHFLALFNIPEILEFTFKKIKDNFSDDQYEEILKSKVRCERNLLQNAACVSKDIKTHQILYKFFRDSCKSDGEFLGILSEADSDKNNVFYLASCFATNEVFEFIVGELEKIASREEIRKHLDTVCMSSRNILQAAAIQNKSLEFHQSLWKIIRKYFATSEIVDMVKHTSGYGNNVLYDAVECNTKEIVELTWNEIKNEMSIKDQVRYLKDTNLSIMKKSNLDVQDWCKRLIQEHDLNSKSCALM